MIRIWFLFWLWGGYFNAFSQEPEWHQIASVPVEDLDQISMDNRENIFYADGGGNVMKLNAKGDLIGQYSPLFQGRLDQLEAFWTFNIFLFSADLQQVVILDLFLNPISVQPIPQGKLGSVKTATLGNNNILWLFDENDLSLVQYDYRRNTPLQELPLGIALGHEKMEVEEILERHNLVFVNIKDKGVFILDNQGNLLQKLNVHIPQKLSIYKDSIYFIKNGSMHRVQYLSGKEEIFKLPDPSYSSILVSANTMVFYSSSFVHIYDRIF